MSIFPFLKYLFIWLCWVLVVACKLLVAECGIQFPDRIEPGSPALGAWSLSHWTTRKVPNFSFVKFLLHLQHDLEIKSTALKFSVSKYIHHLRGTKHLTAP